MSARHQGGGERRDALVDIKGQGREASGVFGRKAHQGVLHQGDARERLDRTEGGELVEVLQTVLVQPEDLERSEGAHVRRQVLDHVCVEGRAKRV